MDQSMTPQSFLDALLPGALAIQEKYGIPASFTLAQAASESRWGDSDLAKKAFNLFGVKADSGWKGPCFNLKTGEVLNGKEVIVGASWRKYGSWAECMEDRVNFFKVNRRYASCWQQTTGEGWARAVQAANYATDPKYADKLIAVMDGRNLQRFDTKRNPK
jgi:flagellum-specific peptidoglycan hydrolase FlgJ